MDAFTFDDGSQLQFSTPPYPIADVVLVALVRRFIEYATVQTVWQVLLGDPMVAVGMWIEVVGPVTQALGITAGVLQVVGNLTVPFGLDGGQGVEESEGGVAFWRRRQIECGLGQVKAALRQADAIEGLGGGGDDGQGVGIGQTHVLAREDDHTPQDELRILAGVDHTCEPIDGGVRVGAAQ